MPPGQPDKAAQTDYPVLEVIRERWSPRAFAERAVEKEKLLSVLEAARWASSSNNRQPWRFIVTRRGDESFGRLLECLREGNVGWAQHASVLILSLAEKEFPARGDKPARENRHAWHDVGSAVGNLILQATALNLYVHQMAGFYPEKASEAFRVPGTFEPVAVLALGYLGDADNLPDALRERELAERTRKPLEELVYGENFGKKAAWLD